MRPAAFDYVRPSTIEEALAVLSQGDAVALAGGQSLIPLLNDRSVSPATVVDIGRIATLQGITRTAESLRIGAAATLAQIAAEPASADIPLLRQAIASVASPAIRNRATLVGNLVRASPTSELPVAMVALDAALMIRDGSGERRVPVRDFFLGPNRSSVSPGEIITAVVIPDARTTTTRQAFAEIAIRAGAPPLACVAVSLDAGDDGTITGARIVAGGIVGIPVRCPQAEAAVIGRSLDTLADAVPADRMTPHPELPDAAYALAVLPVLIERALAQAAAQTGARA